jgi:hypothetical protein
LLPNTLGNSAGAQIASTIEKLAEQLKGGMMNSFEAELAWAGKVAKIIRRLERAELMKKGSKKLKSGSPVAREKQRRFPRPKLPTKSCKFYGDAMLNRAYEMLPCTKTVIDKAIATLPDKEIVSMAALIKHVPDLIATRLKARLAACKIKEIELEPVESESMHRRVDWK